MRSASKQRDALTEVIAWNDVIRNWVRALIGITTSALIVLLIIALVAFEASTWSRCHAHSKTSLSEANELRRSWCDNHDVPRHIRLQRAADTSCINAHNTISEGLWRCTFDCHISTHMNDIGRCRDYKACAWVIDWAETIRGSFTLVLYAILAIAALVLVLVLKHNLGLVGTAVHVTRSLSSRPTLPLRIEHAPPARMPGFEAETLDVDTVFTAPMGGTFTTMRKRTPPTPPPRDTYIDALEAGEHQD